MSRRFARFLLLAFALPAVALAGGDPIENPAVPPGGVETVTLNEAWRAGGEDDDVIFGSIGTVTCDDAGRVYVLDSQLSQVQAYTPDGEHVATLGREGDGPGEVRQPGGMFLMPDGRLALLQTFPGRIVLLHRDGTPAGELAYQPPGGGQQGSFMVLNAAQGLADGMVVLGIRMSMAGGPMNHQTFFLARTDLEGREQAVYLEKPYAVDFSDFRLDEMKMDFVWSRFAADDEGRVYTAPARNEYRIRVQAPDGTVVREFGREFTAAPRDDAAREQAHQVLEGVAAYYQGVPLQGTTIEDVEAAIVSLAIGPDGNVWVQNSNPGDLPEGVFNRLDVFAPDGRFLRQVDLHCPGDARRDGLTLLPDGRVVVIRGALDAWLSQQAVDVGAASATDAPVLEIVCYERS